MFYSVNEIIKEGNMMRRDQQGRGKAAVDSCFQGLSFEWEVNVKTLGKMLGPNREMQAQMSLGIRWEKESQGEAGLSKMHSGMKPV